jgi:hypothetical protein
MLKMNGDRLGIQPKEWSLHSQEQWNKIARDEVTRFVYMALGRVCGGGFVAGDHSTTRNGKEGILVLSDGDVDDRGQQGAAEHLRMLQEMAKASVSFPNRGNVTVLFLTLTHPQQSLRTTASEIDRMDMNNTSSNVKDFDYDIGKPHDIEVRVALKLFHKYKILQKYAGDGVVLEKVSESTRVSDSSSVEISCQNKRHKKASKAKSKPSVSASACLHIISDIGLERSIRSPKDLGAILAQEIEECLLDAGSIGHQQQQQGSDHADAVLPQEWCRDVRVDKSGIICLTTRARAEELECVHGRLSCPTCLTWCKGEKGLWWHQQQEHGIHHSDATHSAYSHSSSSNNKELALVVYKERDIAATATFDQATATNINKEQQAPIIKGRTPPLPRSECFFEVVKRGNLDEIRSIIIVSQCFAKANLSQINSTIMYWCAELTYVFF